MPTYKLRLNAMAALFPCSRSWSELAEDNTSANMTPVFSLFCPFFLVFPFVLKQYTYSLVQVNAALDEVAKMAEANQRLMAAHKSNNMGRIAPADRKRVGDMFYSIAVSSYTRDH